MLLGVVNYEGAGVTEKRKTSTTRVNKKRFTQFKGDKKRINEENNPKNTCLGYFHGKGSGHWEDMAFVI